SGWWRRARRNRRGRWGKRNFAVAKLRDVGTRRQFDLYRGIALILVVILRQTFADFTSRSTHHGIEIGVVIRLAAEDNHAQRTFLEVRLTAAQRLIHQIAQQRRIVLAVLEERADQHPP